MKGRSFLQKAAHIAKNSNKYAVSNLYKYIFSEYYDDALVKKFPPPYPEFLAADTFEDLIEKEPSVVLIEILTINIGRFLLKGNYLTPLALKFRQLVHTDSYGDMRFEAWESEVKTFLKNRLSPHSFYDEKVYLFAKHFFKDNFDIYLNIDDEDRWVDNAISIIDHFVLDLIEKQDEDTNNVADLDSIHDPLEYERAVSELLAMLGWNSRVTPGSGDQGVDVVATKGSRHIVIQCKLYSQPVGNKAVQEAHAAKGFEQAGEAYVVTNNSYTRSAQQLASSLGVTLLHHSQIKDYFGNSKNQDYGFSNAPMNQEDFAIFLEHLFCEIEDAGWEIDKENLSDIQSAYEEGELVLLSRDEEEVALVFIRPPSEAELDEAFAEFIIEMEGNEESPFYESIKIYIVFNGYQTKAQKMVKGFNAYIFNHNEIEDALAMLKT